MPQGNDYFGDTKDALRMMIPVVLNQRNLDMDKQRLTQHAEQVAASLKQRQDELEAAKADRIQQARLQGLTRLADRFTAEGDTENLNKLLPHLKEAFGGLDLQQFSPMPTPAQKGPANEWDLLNRLSGGDTQKLTEIYRRLHPERSDKSLTEDEIIWNKSGGDLNKFLESKERLRRAGQSERAPAETPEAKELRRLEEDIMQLSGRLSSIRSGQNMMDPAMASGRPEVVSDDQKRLKAMLKKYKDLGGKPDRLGFPDEPTAGAAPAAPDWRQFK